MSESDADRIRSTIVMGYGVYFFSFLALVEWSVIVFTFVVAVFAILFIKLYPNLEKPYAVKLGLITYGLATLVLTGSLARIAVNGDLFAYPIFLFSFVLPFVLSCVHPMWILIRARNHE